MPHVPQVTSIDKKTGQSFTYGGFDVTLADCSLCGGIYAASMNDAHVTSPTHAAAKMAASA